jgi:DNA mismatch repair protein MutL
VTFRAEAAQGDLFEALHTRLATVLGRDFADNALPIDAEREGIRLTGYAALPTYSRGSAVAQYLFVNGRPVRDKLLVGALRAAYMDVLSRDRHPAAALFVDCPPERVDVNVHPAKSEVRFREPGIARGLIVSGLRHALAEAGHRASSTVAGATLGAFTPETGARVYQMDRPSPSALGSAARWQAPGLAEETPTWDLPEAIAPSSRVEAVVADDIPATRSPLGAARAQLHENYIVAQTETGMVIVDQHAAHERLVYERLKRQRDETGVARQALLIPEIVTLGSDADRCWKWLRNWRRSASSSNPSAPEPSPCVRPRRSSAPSMPRRSCATSSTNWTTRGAPPRYSPASTPCSAAWPATAPSARAAG